ncbi:MAG: hypothetical protein IID33_04615 [Planctomycetes bacterium]|nr:hypothetical protein [Planctomycetota bacterium]
MHERTHRSLARRAAIALCLCATVAVADSPADRFVAGLDQASSIPAEARDLIRASWADCKDCDGSEFLTQGLAVLSPHFRQGLDAYDAEEYGDCAAVMRDLQSSRNGFIATHAAVYEIKALVALDRLVVARQRIETVLFGSGQASSPMIDIDTYSYFSPEVAFLRGFCLLADLQYEQAHIALDEFVTTYPEASQRLVIAAKQMLMELQNRQLEGLGDVVDLMNYSGRRLNHSDSGDLLRERQDRIVELLDGLIEEAEQQEKSSSSSSGGGSSGGRQQSGGAKPSSPLEESILPGGRGQTGKLGARRRANPGDMWGAMPPAKREQILQALRDNFPRRYRKLVEQYYEELAKKP